VAAAKMPLEEAALVAGTSQNFSNLLFSDIYEQMAAATTLNKSILSLKIYATGSSCLPSWVAC
jgi:hypothetical protein